MEYTIKKMTMLWVSDRDWVYRFFETEAEAVQFVENQRIARRKRA